MAATIEGVAFAIAYSPEAVDHLELLPKSSQVLVVDQVEEQLGHEPMLPTRKRKVLRPNPIAQRHNELWIGEEKITL